MWTSWPGLILRGYNQQVPDVICHGNLSVHLELDVEEDEKPLHLA